MKYRNLLAVALAAGSLALAPGAQAKSWSDLAAEAAKVKPDVRAERRGDRQDNRRDRRDDRRDHRRDDRARYGNRHRNFDRQHRNVRRAMRRHGISRFDNAVWTGNGFRVSGFTARGLIDIVFGYPNYAVRSVAHRRHHARDRYWGGYGDSYRPQHYNRRPLKERRVRRIAARQYGLDVYRTRCVDGRWVLIGNRHGHRHGRYKLALDAFSGRELAFHRIRGHR